MALIREFTRRSSNRDTVHKAIPAMYDVFRAGGTTYLQIDTYGSDQRQVSGKKSQTIQLDRSGAEQLLRILKSEFLLE